MLFNKTFLTCFGQRYLEALSKNPIFAEAEFIKAVCEYNRLMYDKFFQDQPLTPPKA